MTSRDAVRPESARVIPRRSVPPSGVRFLPGGRVAVLCCLGQLEIWDLAMATPTLERKVPLSGRVTDWAPLPDGERFVVGLLDGGLRLVDREGRKLHAFELEPTAARFLGAEPCGLWSTESSGSGKERTHTVREHAPYGTPCEISVDLEGDIAAAAYGQSFVLVWCLRSGRLLSCLGYDRPGHAEHIYRIAISPDGSRVLSRDAYGRLRTWDWRTGQEVGSFRVGIEDAAWDAPAGYGNVRGCGGAGPAIFAGGTRIVAAAGQRIEVFAARTGERLHSWVAHDLEHPIMGEHPGLPRVLALRASADGRRVLSVGVDASLRVWDVNTGAELWSTVPDPCCMDWADLSPDGRQVVWTGCPGTRVYSVR
jgi:WD40 repeat protein